MTRRLGRRFWVVKYSPYHESNHPNDFFVRGATTVWRTHRAPKDWMNGDGVFLWEMHPTLAVVGLGEFLWQLDEYDERGRSLFEVKHLSARLRKPIGIGELRQVPSLQDAAFLKAGPQGTVYSVDLPQAADIHQCVVNANNAFHRLWPECAPRPK